MKRLVSLYITLGILLITTNVVAEDAKVRDAIETAVKNYMTVFNQGDVASVAALYTEDGQVLPPNSDAVKGRPAIQKFWQGVIDDEGDKSSLQLEIIEVESYGDIVYNLVKYTIQGEEKVIDTGKNVFLWKQEDGKWKLYRDIWNSSMPASKQ